MINSRKFTITIMVLLLSYIALMYNKINGGSWVAVSTLVLAAYSAANIAARHIDGKNK